MAQAKPVGTGTLTQSGAQSFVNLNSTSASLNASAATGFITVTSNTAWSVTGTPSWITITAIWRVVCPPTV